MRSLAHSFIVAAGVAVGLAATSGCATLSSGDGGSVAPFQGKEAVQARTKELIDKGSVAGDCINKSTDVASEKGGIVEATVDAAGKVAARSLIWKGSPPVEKCIVEAAIRVTMPPLPGPTVGTLWIFSAPGEKPPEPPAHNEAVDNAIQDLQRRIGENEVLACSQRYLPPEFSADIELSYEIFPGGRAAAITVANSTSKDGDFDTCIQGVIAAQKFPDTHFEGPYPVSMHFHVGRIEAH